MNPDVVAKVAWLVFFLGAVILGIALVVGEKMRWAIEERNERRRKKREDDMNPLPSMAGKPLPGYLTRPSTEMKREDDEKDQSKPASGVRKEDKPILVEQRSAFDSACHFLGACFWVVVILVCLFAGCACLLRGCLGGLLEV